MSRPRHVHVVTHKLRSSCGASFVAPLRAAADDKTTMSPSLDISDRKSARAISAAPCSGSGREPMAESSLEWAEHRSARASVRA